ncbi:MAG: hypothetical protein R3A78_02780 [Polyangiales bacterium]|nr:hypothetical protein [Myxococcales bacterium]
MKRIAPALVLLGLVAFVQAPAFAQGDDDADVRTALGVESADELPPALASAQEASAEDAPAEEDDGVWKGPHVELGYSHFVLADGYGAGSVNAGFFGGFLPLDTWLRIGLSAEMGSRSYTLGDNDLLVRGTLVAGYQHLGLDRFMPYAVAVATMGAVVGKRFHSPLAEMLVGGGVEIGADVSIEQNFYAGIGLSYIRASMWNLAYDVFVFRFRIGL